MKTHLMILACVVFLITSCRKDELISTDQFQTVFPSISEPLDHVWILSGEWSGYMGIAIALSADKYYYWFYSDVILKDKPEYPISGSYELDRDSLTLDAGGQRLYSEEWIITTYSGKTCLWAKKDIGILDRLLFPDDNFDATNPFRNQSISDAEPDNGAYLRYAAGIFAL